MEIKIIVCCYCDRVKKHGDWVKVSNKTMRSIKRFGIIYDMCPDCQGDEGLLQIAKKLEQLKQIHGSQLN